MIVWLLYFCLILKVIVEQLIEHNSTHLSGIEVFGGTERKHRCLRSPAHNWTPIMPKMKKTKKHSNRTLPSIYDRDRVSVKWRNNRIKIGQWNASISTGNVSNSSITNILMPTRVSIIMIIEFNSNKSDKLIEE